MAKKRSIKKSKGRKEQKNRELQKAKKTKKDFLAGEEIPMFEVKKIRVKVVGIGGGGGSIISEIAPRLKKIKFIAANTDSQALKESSREAEKFQFGKNLTKGLGTGMNPLLGARAAEKERDKIRKIFENQDLSIIVACLGGGTGSGAAPVFTKIAKDLRSVTFGIFTLPFEFEGKKRKDIATSSLEKLKPNLNAYVIIPNEKIFQIIDQKTSIKESFSEINKIIAKCLEGLIELIYSPGLINIDFADLKTILEGRGKLAYLNTAEAQGSNRVEEIIKRTLNNPLYEYGISGAERILFNIVGSHDLKMAEVEKVSKNVSDLSPKAKIIFGISQREKYAGWIKVTLLAIGCDHEEKLPVEFKERKKGSRPRVKKRKKKMQKSAKRKIKIKLKEIEPTKEQGSSFEKTEEKNDNKIAKSALDIKKDIEKAEQEILNKDNQWELPAFLRKKTEK